MSIIHGEEIEFAYIVVLQKAGRLAQYNTHLHLMIAGGLVQNKWHNIDYLTFDLFSLNVHQRELLI